MFSESLQIDIALEIDGKEFKIPGGNIKMCKLEMHSFGFTGKAEFGLFSDSDEDELFPLFVTQKIIKINLSITRVYNIKDENPVPLTMQAYVTGKSVEESLYRQVKKDPVLKRHYEIFFEDIPAVLWKQHFPVQLYTDKKISDVIKDHAFDEISIEIGEDIQEKTNEMVFLGLEKKHNKASFYDFFIWYVDVSNMAIVYNYNDGKIKLSEKKPSEKSSNVFYPSGVDALKTVYPETLRHNSRILNVHSEKYQEVKITQDESVTGIRHDIVMRTPITKDIDDRKKAETLKLKNSLEQIELTLKEFPSNNCTIGTMVNFEKEYWSKNNLLSEKKFRVFEIHMSAVAEKQDLSENYNADHASYNMDMLIKMEIDENPFIHLPCFKKPEYPVMVEGKIVSESGEDTDKTYQIYTDDETSLENYKIYIPLWDMNIKAPFIPGVYTGHFYFPAFKHARVLVAMYMDHAFIKSFLDWGEGSRLPMDIQGNHILFGKNALSETSMKYLYSEGKPVFTVQRTSDSDNEMIKMQEESIILQTKDEE